MPELKPGSSRCMCDGCKLFFSRTSVFDAHRVGPHDERRRCLTADELVAKGYVERDGVWGYAASRPDHLNVPMFAEVEES